MAHMKRARVHLRALDPEWSWRFLLLEAKLDVWKGLNQEALQLLQPELPNGLAGGDLEIEQAMLRALANDRLGDHELAAQELRQAAQICDRTGSRLDAELFSIRGIVALQDGRDDDAESLFRQGLELARQRQDDFLQSIILLNLGVVALDREHFDEALYWSNAATDKARSAGARSILEKAMANAGWAYYQLGDIEKALTNFRQAGEEAEKLDVTFDEVTWINNSGLAQYEMGALKDAEASYRKSLSLAKTIQTPQVTLEASTALGFVLLQLGKLEEARVQCDEALKIAASLGTKSAWLDPMFLQALLAKQTGDRKKAEEILTKVEAASTGSPSQRWKVEDQLAKLHEEAGELRLADDWFRRSIQTFEVQRSSLRSDETRLPFFTNASQVYGDYSEYLVNQGREEDALKLIDIGRARTLAEGLGITSIESNLLTKDDLNLKRVARKLNGTVLSYWLGPRESYLWAISTSQVRLFKLPKGPQIEALVKSHQRDIANSNDLVAAGSLSGSELYDLLVRPALPLIPRNSRVFVVPDGSLNQLNFETLLVTDPKPHYWIEDADIVNGNSLRLLGAFAAHRQPKRPDRLLLIGDPVSPGGAFEDLPNASREAATIEKHFASENKMVLTREQALPSAYAANHPEQYSYIHFVAHGTASLANPLESAVILSRTPGDPDTFKLYARDIMHHPLRSELVTISACYGSGARAYAGEGLIGLSWAFLRAGSHYVAGALWEVNDASTPQMMDDMYAGLARGEAPDVAMRGAKLAMVHSSGTFRKPLYWGSFQMYAGS